MNYNSLVIIDPSTIKPEIAAINYISSISPFSVSIHFPALFGTETLTDCHPNIAGMIVLGSKASVHDHYTWQSVIEEKIKWCESMHIPVLGICYGFQLIAHIYGGRVAYLWDRTKKRGMREIRLSENNLIRHTLKGNVPYSHQEGVVECPKSFHVIASSNMVEIEGISSFSNTIYGFQPHIEAVDGFLHKDEIHW